MKKTSSAALFAAVFSVVAAIAPPAASETDAMVTKVQMLKDVGASERVEAAALLRVLSQEAASAACHMANNIAQAEARTLMVEAKGKFSLLLDALQYGNPTLNINGEEPRKKTILKIEALREEWAPIHQAAVTLLEDPSNKDALTRIKAENEAVLASASTLTSTIAGDYSNPAELIQADVMLVDFSGRQAMLTQKMAKIACEIWAGNRS